MITQAHTDISRRKFLVAGGFAIAAAYFRSKESLRPARRRTRSRGDESIRNGKDHGPKLFAAISAFFWVLVETLLSSPALTES
jgi:hypothetical protein